MGSLAVSFSGESLNAGGSIVIKYRRMIEGNGHARVHAPSSRSRLAFRGLGRILGIVSDAEQTSAYSLPRNFSEKAQFATLG